MASSLNEIVFQLDHVGFVLKWKRENPNAPISLYACLTSQDSHFELLIIDFTIATEFQFQDWYFQATLAAAEKISEILFLCFVKPALLLYLFEKRKKSLHFVVEVYL